MCCKVHEVYIGLHMLQVVCDYITDACSGVQVCLVWFVLQSMNLVGCL